MQNENIKSSNVTVAMAVRWQFEFEAEAWLLIRRRGTKKKEEFEDAKGFYSLEL